MVDAENSPSKSQKLPRFSLKLDSRVFGSEEWVRINVSSAEKTVLEAPPLPIHVSKSLGENGLMKILRPDRACPGREDGFDQFLFICSLLSPSDAHDSLTGSEIV